MIIKLLSIQIPQYWELLKYIAVKADEIDKENLQSYLNELLHSLLNDKSQCWVRFDDNREIIAVMITQINIDKVNAQKYLSIKNLYSFKAVSDNINMEDINFIKEFAKKEQCAYMSFKSRNKRIWQLGEMNGFKEDSRTFNFRLTD